MVLHNSDALSLRRVTKQSDDEDQLRWDFMILDEVGVSPLPVEQSA